MKTILLIILMTLATPQPRDVEYGIQFGKPYCYDADEYGKNWCMWCDTNDNKRHIVSFWEIFGKWHIIKTSIGCDEEWE